MQIDKVATLDISCPKWFSLQLFDRNDSERIEPRAEVIQILKYINDN